MVSIRVIVIDDSAFMRKVISNILESSPTIEVIATARNGEDGLKKIQKYEPDVVTLDVEMPIMGGMETLEKIMKYYSLPVVMLSSVSDKDKEKVVQRSEEHTSELQSRFDLVCRLLLEKKKTRE